MTELTDKQIADEFDLMMRPRVLPDFVVFARAVIAADRALQNNAWRKAIDDARLSLMLDITAPDANPAASVKELVAWANELALNPAISSDAQALIDRGLAMQAERHREELDAYALTVANLREQPEQCWCDEQGIGKPGVSCGDCPTRDYKRPERKPMPENGAQYLALSHLPLSFRERGIAIVRAVEAIHGIEGTK